MATARSTLPPATLSLNTLDATEDSDGAQTGVFRREPRHCFAVVLDGSRCMGFQTGDAEGQCAAERLAAVLGDGARVDRIEAPIPLDLEGAALNYEASLRALAANVVPIRALDKRSETVEVDLDPEPTPRTPRLRLLRGGRMD